VSPNYEKALKSFENAYKIDQSESDVIFMIGLMYNYGVGCELDSPKVLKIWIHNQFLILNFLI
jgi:TPR repeat protein